MAFRFVLVVARLSKPSAPQEACLKAVSEGRRLVKKKLKNSNDAFGRAIQSPGKINPPNREPLEGGRI